MKRLTFLLFLISVMAFSAESAVIIKIKGRKALIKLEGATAEKGDRFDALNLYGKPLGLLEIRKVKRDKAIAVLIKGKMEVNWILDPSDDSQSSFKEESPSDFKAPSSQASAKSQSTASLPLSPTLTETKHTFYDRQSHKALGLFIGPYLNWVRLSSSTSASGFSWKTSGTFDLIFNQYLSVRLNAGYQTLKVEGQDCDNITNCKLVLHYPGAGLLLRVSFLKNTLFQPWVGVGGQLFWPIVNKQYDLGLDEKSFNGFHGSLLGAIGVDIQLKTIYFPIQLEMGWINPVLISFNPVKEGSKEFKPLYVGLLLGIGFYM